MTSHHNPSRHPHEGANGGNLQHSQGPYWKRAHRDWRMWAMVILMITCMGIYLLTGDLRWRFHAPPQPMVPIAG